MLLWIAGFFAAYALARTVISLVSAATWPAAPAPVLSPEDQLSRTIALAQEQSRALSKHRHKPVGVPRGKHG